MSIVKHLKSTLVQRVPILSWAPTYTSEKLVSDAIAGITVGLTVMPQALAYATLAGLEPQVTTFDSHRSVEMFSTETLAFLMLLLQYGLYSAFVGCFVYTIFGTCKDITIGPTALMALMTYQQIAGRNTDYAMLLCFLTGVVQLVMAILHLGTNGIKRESLKYHWVSGVLIDFISIPVTVGFTSATSVIIMTSQLKSLLGLKISSSGFLDTITKVIKHIRETRMADLGLGLVCIAVLMLLRVSQRRLLIQAPPFVEA